MTINDVFLGRCFSELQVEGVECELTKRPYDISVSFILSSLRLIDAVQTFGADYELLVSSKPPGIAGMYIQIHIVLCHIAAHKNALFSEKRSIYKRF